MFCNLSVFQQLTFCCCFCFLYKIMQHGDLVGVRQTSLPTKARPVCCLAHQCRRYTGEQTGMPNMDPASGLAGVLNGAPWKCVYLQRVALVDLHTSDIAITWSHSMYSGRCKISSCESVCMTATCQTLSSNLHLCFRYLCNITAVPQVCMMFTNLYTWYAYNLTVKNALWLVHGKLITLHLYIAFCKYIAFVVVYEGKISRNLLLGSISDSCEMLNLPLMVFFFSPVEQQTVMFVKYE